MGVRKHGGGSLHLARCSVRAVIGGGGGVSLLEELGILGGELASDFNLGDKLLRYYRHLRSCKGYF